LQEEYRLDDSYFAINFRGLTSVHGFFIMKKMWNQFRQLDLFKRWLSKQETYPYGYITQLHHNRHRHDDVDCDAAYATNS
jgi:hypothetical protein